MWMSFLEAETMIALCPIFSTQMKASGDVVCIKYCSVGHIGAQLEHLCLLERGWVVWGEWRGVSWQTCLAEAVGQHTWSNTAMTAHACHEGLLHNCNAETIPPTRKIFISNQMLIINYSLNVK